MRARAVACVIAIACAACSSTEDEAPRPLGPAEGSKLEKTACRFLAPRSVEGKTYYCADLPVPENRGNPSSRTIKLHVAVIKGKDGGVPTIELMGGPGGASEALVGGIAARRKSAMPLYAPLLAKGDVVLFDQRGTGRSLPHLS